MGEQLLINIRIAFSGSLHQTAVREPARISEMYYSLNDVETDLNEKAFYMNTNELVLILYSRVMHQNMSLQCLQHCAYRL